MSFSQIQMARSDKQSKAVASSSAASLAVDDAIAYRYWGS